MVGPANANYADNARVALDLWRALEGSGLPIATDNPEAAQKALKRYSECLKAVLQHDYDLTKV
jgi:hypothetical protein